MLKNFLPNLETIATPNASQSDTQPNREPVRIILIGSARGIRLIIQILYRLGFAEPRAWSELQVMPQSDRLMSILTKWIC